MYSASRWFFKSRSLIRRPFDSFAQIAIEMSKSGTPLDVVFGWSPGSSLKLALEFLLFGQGDVPNVVYDLVEKAVPDQARRPTVLVG